MRVVQFREKMSSLATRIKNIFSFNSDSYHVHKATEEELLTRPQPQPPISSVGGTLRRAPPPPTSATIRMVGGSGASGTTGSGGNGGAPAVMDRTNQSNALKASDKKTTKRKVSLL